MSDTETRRPAGGRTATGESVAGGPATGGAGTWGTALSPELRALLHREAEGDLSAGERAALEAAGLDPEVQRARHSLRRGLTLLTGPIPPAPRSVASAVVADLRLARQLTAPALSPTQANALATEVSGEIASSAALRPALVESALVELALPHPTLPRSVAASVAHDIAFSQHLTQQLGQVPLPPVASVAPAVLSEMRAASLLVNSLPGNSLLGSSLPGNSLLGATLPPSRTSAPPRSVAAALAAKIAHDARKSSGWPGVPVSSLPCSLGASSLIRRTVEGGMGAFPVTGAPTPGARSSRAPLLLVGGLLAGLTLLTVTAAWPNLAAGALVLRTVLDHVAPVAGLGLLLLLLTSALVAWVPTPTVRRFGAGAFVLAGALSLPPLYGLTHSAPGLSFGRPVEVYGQVRGDIVAIGGDVTLHPGAEVQGRVVTLLGDIKQAPGTQVHGEISAVLGHTPGDSAVAALPAPRGVHLATAAAFRPLIGWLSAAAWPQIFVALTGGLLLLLFVAGTAPALARRQRHAPMRTLALGVLILAALTLPSMALAFAGLLGPALLMLALAGLLVATGLSVSVYDLGRALACRLRLPVADTVGAFVGISLFAGSLSWAPLAFALALVGGAWGAGTLLLQRQEGEVRLSRPVA